jgi:phospholipid:diacylglycerol acyltransferase
MISKILMDRLCWLEHMSLNQSNFDDPQGVKLRGALGLSASDYLVAGYWVWGKMIENLADVGYNENSIYMASYDWRLPYDKLESRDFYFTRLVANVELQVKMNGQRAVVITHSMGGLVFLYFLKWVENSSHGAAWIERNIESVVNLGVPFLGATKATSSVISGEMKDTAELNVLLEQIKESFLSRQQVMDLFRSWGSIPLMFPKGGERVWGNKTFSRDGGSPYIQFSSKNADASLSSRCDSKPLERSITLDAKKQFLSRGSITAGEALELIEQLAPNYWQKITQIASWGYSDDPRTLDERDHRYWANPLESRLPNVKNVTIYCLYGTGKATERAYAYKENDYSCNDALPFIIDKSKNAAFNSSLKSLVNGVETTDGDGTVPLLSLGYPAVTVWRKESHNPGKLPVIVREYKHRSMLEWEAGKVHRTENLIDDIIRGGGHSADHVDMLGSYELLSDVIRIVTGYDQVKERIFSNIHEISQ